MKLYLCSLQVTVETSSRPAPFHKKLDASLTQLGQALAGGNLQTITKAIFNHDGLKKHVMHKVTDLINVEITELCKKVLPHHLCSAKSQLRNFPISNGVSALLSCNWRPQCFWRWCQHLLAAMTIATKGSVEMLTTLESAWQLLSWWKKETEKCVVFKLCFHLFCSLPGLKSRYVQCVTINRKTIEKC